MKNPVVMIAFGTTSKTISTYESLHEKISKYFLDREILWAFSSRIITRRLNRKTEKKIRQPKELLHHLARTGYRSVTVQSLHLFPGTEFSSLKKILSGMELPCFSGSPLLTSPSDYTEICNILKPLIASSSDTATVLIGHGTKHPAWTGYFCLEKYLRRHFGNSIYVGTVEDFPDTTSLVDEIASEGFRKVRLIPFFLVAGMHYERDIAGTNDTSWQSRFRKKGIKTEAIEQGLGTLKGFDRLIIRHIEEATEIPFGNQS
ncbi:sirohydrochlorin cobaltochelatase [Desulfomarina profundi]|uniref:Sirohydrochlorin cobaltochelatase n=1 Tax=Desulfomarina profundi TaxID=2772557 RepID=A0A8D5FKA9_9BACT|nr:sirohydrochlorin cobaltochelatase [Desulfomarina profundi]BCL62938.1 sirohydrochlorin cobaltochelatase [Desulfomarina profundi]